MRMAWIIAGMALLWSFSCPVTAAETLDELQQQRQALATDLHQRRTELLTRDEALKALHQKIMALHKELALRLDNHRELRDLVKRLRELEVKLSRLEATAKEASAPTPPPAPVPEAGAVSVEGGD